MSRGELRDQFGRTIRNMRISITDRCNFRCIYCMPKDPVWMKRNEILSFEEIARIARIAVDCGIQKIRLTGGEPTVRRGCPDLIRMLLGIEGLKDIGLTTNGYLLKELAGELWDAGLRRLNVSLDTRHGEKFHQIARRDGLEHVIAGLEEAERVGFRPLKVNMVVVKGFNDDEVADFALLARERPYEIRFIEYMPLDGDGAWKPEQVITAEEIMQSIRSVHNVIPVEGQNPSDPARRYRFADGKGEIGIISSVSEPFCGQCDRVRLTADGKLRTCLFAVKETDLREAMRGGATDDDIAECFVQAVWRKEEGHMINRPEFQRPERAMYAIGG